LGTTQISLKIRVVFPSIQSNSLDFALNKEVKGKISSYICFLSLPCLR
jgi:hypothetical protein